MRDVAAIPGDGIGPEVVGAALQVLQAATTRTGDRLQVEHLDWGGERYLREGAPDARRVPRPSCAVTTPCSSAPWAAPTSLTMCWCGA